MPPTMRVHPAATYFPSGVDSHVRVPVTTTATLLEGLVTIPTITSGASTLYPTLVYLSKELGQTGDVLVTWSGQDPTAKLATPGSITVTPTLTQTASITTVAGAVLVDGDYFTIDDGTTAYVFEFDSGGGVTGGRTAVPFVGGETADQVRDLVIIAINSTAILATATSGGTATVTLSMDTPGSAGGTNTENVTDAGFAVTSFADPTHVTTVTYRLVAKDSTGYTTDGGAASSTTTATATLSAANYNALSWSAVPGAASYDVYRTVSPTTPSSTGRIATGVTGTTLNDTGLAGNGAAYPTVNQTPNLGVSLPLQPAAPLCLVFQNPGYKTGMVKLVASAGATTVFCHAKFEWLDSVIGV